MTENPLENKPLTPAQRELLTFFEQVWLEDGNVPSKDACVEAGICKAAFYDSAVKDVSFRRACLVRGISLVAPSERSRALTPEQLRVANTMLDLRDNRSQKNKLKDLNVPTQRWEAWLRDPAFQSYLQRRAENLLGDNLHESHLALVERVRSGDINAIKYYNEITGRYVPNSRDKVDVNAILMRVLEIIQQYVPPETAGLVAEKLLELSTINPALMPSREMRVIEGSVGNGGPL